MKLIKGYWLASSKDGSGSWAVGFQTELGGIDKPIVFFETPEQADEFIDKYKKAQGGEIEK